MLTGNDIANVNGSSAYSRTSGDFVILKASEGTSFRDGYNGGWAMQARRDGRLVGHYHYAHLTNDPVAEADWFVRCANPQAGEVMVLDFEPYGQPVAPAAYPAWIATFLARVNAQVACNTWLYLNDDMGSKVITYATGAQLQTIRTAPLWKAAYSSSFGSLLGWPTLAAWQYGGTGIDSDYCYLTPDQWRATGAGGGSSAANSPIPQIPGLSASAPVPLPPVTPKPLLEEDMFVAVCAGRGIWLIGPGYAHCFNGEEWAQFRPLFVVPGYIRVQVFDPSPVGMRQFDLVRAIHTQPTV